LGLTHYRQEGYVSVWDLPSELHSFRKEFEELYRQTLEYEADVVLLVVDASRTTLGPIDDLIGIVDEFIAQNVLSSEDVWIVANCMDKVPGFYCIDKNCKEFYTDVMVEQFSKLSRLIVDQSHIVPTSAKLSLQAIAGRKKIVDLAGSRTSGLGKLILDKIDHEPWIADVAHFVDGENWQNITIHYSSPKWWMEAFDTVAARGHVHGPRRGQDIALSNTIISHSLQVVISKGITCWIKELSNACQDFWQCIQGPQQDDVRLPQSAFKNSFDLFFADLEKLVGGKIGACLPNDKDFERFHQDLPDLLRKCDIGFDKAEGRAGVRLSQNKGETSVVGNFFIELGRVIVNEYQEKFVKCMMEIDLLVKKTQKKWKRTVECALFKWKVDKTACKMLIDKVSETNLPHPRDVEVFHKGDGALEAFCQTFVKMNVGPPLRKEWYRRFFSKSLVWGK